MTKWDYRIYILDDAVNNRAEEEKRLTALGNQGWELITDCFRVGAEPYIIFKRPVEEEESDHGY